jgi:hypothetical protein
MTVLGYVFLGNVSLRNVFLGNVFLGNVIFLPLKNKNDAFHKKIVFEPCRHKRILRQNNFT